MSARSLARGPAIDDSREARLGRRIEPQPNGCWLFKGKTDTYGTAKAVAKGNSNHAHRVVYEILVDTIPAGHHLHHECMTPGCVNPAHMLVLTPAQHRRRHT